MSLAESFDRQIREDEVFHHAMETLDTIYYELVDRYCAEKSIDMEFPAAAEASVDADKLSKEEKEKLDTAAFLVLSNIDYDSDLTVNEWIDKILLAEGSAKFDRCVSRVLKSLMDKEQKPVSTKKRKRLRSRSFAICTTQLGKKEAQK